MEVFLRTRLFLWCMANFLTNGQVIELKRLHKTTRDLKKGDRIKAILLLNDGYTEAEVARILLINESTIWRWYDIYKYKGLKDLLKDKYQGGSTRMNPDQLEALDQHLINHVYTSCKDICEYVERVFGIHYTIFVGLVLLLPHYLNLLLYTSRL